MILYYDHRRRQIFREDVGDQSLPVTIEFAKVAYEDGLDDFNLALRQLALRDWDMEAVEKYYRDREISR